MSNPMLSEQLTTVLVAALGLPSVNLIVAHSNPMRAADMGRKRGAEHDAAGIAKKGYGLVLERRKDFVAATGITGAATGRIDPLGDTPTLEPKGTYLTIGPLKSRGG